MSGVQAADNALHWSKLGRVHVISLGGDGTVYLGLNEVFGMSEYDRPIPELDHWLRRRVRLGSWKQWRTCRTKVRNLLKRGVSLKAAMSVGMSRKSSWHLSKTYATQLGMSNQWLKEQGVISIKDLWVSMHDPATAR
jgi:RNA-directed DNA polymerase